MKKTYGLLILMLMIANVSFSRGPEKYEHDHFEFGGNNLDITFIGHATLMLKYNNTIIHVDPVSAEADYNDMPDADIILITHEHGDHLDPGAVEKISKPSTIVICNGNSAQKLKNPVILKNGEDYKVGDILIQAVPAYNIVNQRSPGNPFHPKGVGNGYVLNMGKERVYIAGDTEDIPEMSNLGKIDIAFLPMNLPYTMTPEMVQHAAEIIKPGILYPYHFGKTDTSKIVDLLKNSGIEVRIRKME